MPVISVTQDQQQDSTGNLTEVYTVTFTLPDKPGQFTVTVPAAGDPVAAANAAINATTAQVEGIYAL